MIMKTTLKLIIGVTIILAFLLGTVTYLAYSKIPPPDSNSTINKNSSSINPTSNPTISLPNASKVNSIQFNVSDAKQGGPIIGEGKTAYFAKNIGTSNLEIRTQSYNRPNGIQVTIINGVQKNAWYYENNDWKTYPSSLVNYSNLYQGPIQYYTDAIIANWTGSSNFTYTFEDQSGVYARVIISDIVINPSLPDSLFKPNN
jgi:hypothetical protein